MNFSDYKFRCSSLGYLMTNSRTKKDPLSETTKSYLRELWIKEVFEREKYDTTNKYTSKGLQVEPDSMDLVHRVTGNLYFKNREKINNDFISGTPDIICRDDNKTPCEIKDIKSSWDIWTYAKVDEKSARSTYYWQLWGYMWLTQTVKSELLYCLVDTPDGITNDELYRLSYKIGDSEEVLDKARKNFEFGDIPDEMKVKNFSFDFSAADIPKVQERIFYARDYLNNMSLN